MSLIKDYSKPIFDGSSFAWKEYCLLRGWNKLAQPTSEQELHNAIFLFTAIQPLRKLLGKPLIITSGCRTPAYTTYLRSRGVPAATRSAHNSWQAVDLTCPGMTNRELWNFFHKYWAGRMELLKYTPTWVHLDTREWGKRQRFKP